MTAARQIEIILKHPEDLKGDISARAIDRQQSLSSGPRGPQTAPAQKPNSRQTEIILNITFQDTDDLKTDISEKRNRHRFDI